MTWTVNKFVQTLVDGLSNGAIYASLALALVLVHRATHIPNFAQGELAMLSAFIAWEIQDRGAPWIVALLGVDGDLVPHRVRASSAASSAGSRARRR